MLEIREGVENTGDVLTQAAPEILERMFFLFVEEVAPEVGTETAVEADARPGEARRESRLVSEISFHGAHSGRLRLVVPESCAGELAANFLGVLNLRQLGSEQIAEVLRELTNMMCGTTLSRLAPQAVFNLDPPVLLTAKPDGNFPALARRLQSGTDCIDLYWHWDAGGSDGADLDEAT
jgi:CheY-specific phosphatase CheX